MLFRIQPLFSLFLRRIPAFQSRINASSTPRRADDDNLDDNENNKQEEEEASVASMIGPYVSSKQIAFHTGQFDSEQIQKKNKQASLVCII
jgi:hypothetical protein